MDNDIAYIIEEERRLALLLDEAKTAALEKIEKHRHDAALLKQAELERTTAEYKIMTVTELAEIRKAADNEIEELRRRQDSLNGDLELREKITGRIVSLILEDR